jgi:hypothetical protein
MADWNELQALAALAREATCNAPERVSEPSQYQGKAEPEKTPQRPADWADEHQGGCNG